MSPGTAGTVMLSGSLYRSELFHSLAATIFLLPGAWAVMVPSAEIDAAEGLSL